MVWHKSGCVDFSIVENSFKGIKILLSINC
jgi:hypothetical protein